MSCPFMDPEMLMRIPPEKREEMKEMYHKMKKDEDQHLKIDVKEEDIEAAAKNPAEAMMAAGCPMGGSATAGSGEEEQNFNMQDLFENDPQAFMERMSEMSSGGGSCPFMASKHWDPFNQKVNFGYNC